MGLICHVEIQEAVYGDIVKLEEIAPNFILPPTALTTFCALYNIISSSFYSRSDVIIAFTLKMRHTMSYKLFGGFSMSSQRLLEIETRARFITPKLIEAGWDIAPTLFVDSKELESLTELYLYIELQDIQKKHESDIFSLEQLNL